MRVEIEKPNTIMFKVYPDRSDELYHQCMWARVTFDLKNWSMTAQSDCGDYSYSWCVEKGKRTFLQLMTQIEEGYLLGKIANRSKFDVKASKENVCEWIRQDEGITPEERNRRIEGVNDIENYSNASDFLEALEEVEGIEDYYDLWECLESDYPTSAKTFAKIFTEIIQPEIKRYIKVGGLDD